MSVLIVALACFFGETVLMLGPHGQPTNSKQVITAFRKSGEKPEIGLLLQDLGDAEAEITALLDLGVVEPHTLLVHDFCEKCLSSASLGG